MLFDVEPYSYEGSDGQPTGIQVDKVRALAEQAGFLPRIELTSFARRDQAIAQGDADMTIGFETEALKKSAFKLGPIMTVNSILLLRHGLQPSVLEDLDQLRVGRIRGGCADLRPNGQAFQAFHDFNNYVSGLSMLQSARLDVVCGTEDAIRFGAQQAGVDLAAHRSMVLTANREVWIFVARQVPEAVRRRIEQALNALPAPVKPQR
ncbi:transporter substrate-binding domain-containing protein [Pseudomonas sp. J452]|uniref:substrate-binding periplasmic protein n=1 Tax=Pseudomonas sp. J452 TaxID=2898441 RepID=UPI0021ADFE37|nr:transporter substrate-binding domain-containing protein [Pseudomonas sp. J452]UUY10589.1 transporter substrate-binding domain-containing protein [Pseudomonas sp. J452]